MRGAIVTSTIVHLVLLAGLWTVRHERTLVIPGPDVVQVALIEPGAPAVTPRPEPPAPKPVEKVEAVKPAEEKGIKIAPAKPRQKPREKAEKEAPPREPEPAALPYSEVGGAGLRGQVAVDAKDFEFTYYLVLVRNKIASSWIPPSGLAPGGPAARAVVSFRIGRGGEITGVQLESGSGFDYFDRTAVHAVVVSDPLPPLPLAYTGSDLGVHFGFEYAVP